MSLPTFEEMARRLDHLERTNQELRRTCRRWRRVGRGVLLGGLVAVIAGAKYADELKTIEASHFVLKDKSGKMKAALGIRADGTPGLGLFDQGGKVRLSLDISPDGTPGVNIYDKESALRAALAIRPDGTPGLGLFNEKKEVRLSLDVNPDGTPGVHAYDKSNVLRAALAVRPDGTPGLGLFDAEGRICFSLDGEVGAQEAQAQAPQLGPLH